MQRLNGYIKLHRQMLQWGWYKDPVVKVLFLHLLLTASFRDTEWMGRTIEAGQVVTSYANLSEELGFSVKQIRTALKKLKKTGEVASEGTNKYTVITLVNWAKYQVFSDDGASKKANEGQSEGKQGANEGQHRKNVNNITEEGKEEKEIGASPDSSLSSSEDDWRARASR